MKKHIAILLSTLVIFAGCAANGTSNAGKADNAKTTAVATEKGEAKTIEGKMNEVVKLTDYEIKVTKVEVIKDVKEQDAIKITYDFKNLQDKEIAPTVALTFKVKQDGKTLPIAAATDAENGANSKTKAKKGEEVKNCVIMFSPNGTADLEIMAETFGKKAPEMAVIKTAYPK